MGGIAALAAALVTALGAGVGFACDSQAASGTAIKVTFWERGERAGGKPEVWTLRCAPARGTLPKPGVACRKLAEGGWKLVTPVPQSAICTEIYGGPQEARIVGRIEGRKVWAKLGRQNGCHIARWDRLSPWLLPAGGVR